MFTIGYFDDKKENWQSHEMVLLPDKFNDNDQVTLGASSFETPITDLTGYGSTKEEAFEDLMNKVNVYMNALNKEVSDLKSLISNEKIKEHIITEVDSFHRPVNEIKRGAI